MSNRGRKEVAGEGFSAVMLEAIDEGLLALGDRDVIYSYVERKSQIRREEIPENLESFNRALSGLFGPAVETIENIITTRLYERLGLNFTKHENWTLIDHAAYAKKLCEQLKEDV